jgi:pimeloyl-ACP methyl ester carboxylesterase
MINYFVKRVSSSRPKKDGAGTIWLLNGGPGFSGVTMECMLPQIIDLTEGRFDVAIPDHRGTGRSSPLFCDWEDDSAAFSKECVDAAMEHYGIQYLNHFTTPNAARDMHAAIDQIGRRTPERPVMIHAVTYGTILAQRFLQIFPDGVDAVVLDSVVSPDLMRSPWTSPPANAAIAVLVDECANDPNCKSLMVGTRRIHPFYRMQLVS